MLKHPGGLLVEPAVFISIVGALTLPRVGPKSDAPRFAVDEEGKLESTDGAGKNACHGVVGVTHRFVVVVDGSLEHSE